MPNKIRTKTKDSRGRVTKTIINDRTGLEKTIQRGGGKPRTVTYKEGMPRVYRDNPQWAAEDLLPAGLPKEKRGGPIKAYKSGGTKKAVAKKVMVKSKKK